MSKDTASKKNTLSAYLKPLPAPARAAPRPSSSRVTDAPASVPAPTQPSTSTRATGGGATEASSSTKPAQKKRKIEDERDDEAQSGGTVAEGGSSSAQAGVKGRDQGERAAGAVQVAAPAVPPSSRAASGGEVGEAAKATGATGSTVQKRSKPKSTRGPNPTVSKQTVKEKELDAALDLVLLDQHLARTSQLARLQQEESKWDNKLADVLAERRQCDLEMAEDEAKLRALALKVEAWLETKSTVRVDRSTPAADQDEVDLLQTAAACVKGAAQLRATARARGKSSGNEVGAELVRAALAELEIGEGESEEMQLDHE